MLPPADNSVGDQAAEVSERSKRTFEARRLTRSNQAVEGRPGRQRRARTGASREYGGAEEYRKQAAFSCDGAGRGAAHVLLDSLRHRMSTGRTRARR
jgi:hypothetical protein